MKYSLLLIIIILITRSITYNLPRYICKTHYGVITHAFTYLRIYIYIYTHIIMYACINIINLYIYIIIIMYIRYTQYIVHNYGRIQILSSSQEGATGIQNVEDLEPVTAGEMPCPARFEGSFEAARAQAFLKSKLLVPGMQTQLYIYLSIDRYIYIYI